MSSTAPASASCNLGQAQGSGDQGFPPAPSQALCHHPSTCKTNKQGPEGIVLAPFIMSAAPICKRRPQITFKMYEMSPLVRLTVSE